MPKYFEDGASEIFDLCKSVLIKKQKDYGPNNILLSPFGPEIGLLVRLMDKLQRAANLIKNNKTPENEPLADTWLDIANYAIIALLVSKGYFKLPLKEGGEHGGC